MSSRAIVLAIFLGASVGIVPADAQTFMTTANVTAPQYPLLLSKAVQKELNLTEDQSKKIEAKIQESMPEGMNFKPSGGEGKAGDGAPRFSIVIGGAKGAPPVGGAVQIDPSNIRMPKMPDFKKVDEEVLKLLDQPQRDRLKQLHLQQHGVTALAQDKLADEVGLEEEQRDLIKHIMDEHRKKQRELVSQLSSGDVTPESLGELMRKLQESIEKDIGLLLTEDQKGKWEKLTGPKFDFKK
jgi:hypothetical protein